VKISGQQPIFTTHTASSSERAAIEFQRLLYVILPVRRKRFAFDIVQWRGLAKSTLKISEFLTVNADGVAVMPESVQQSIDHFRIAQKVRPFLID